MNSIYAFIISFGEFVMAGFIIQKYSEDMEVEEFISRAPLDDIYRVFFHGSMGSLMMQLGTILAVMR